MPVKKLYTDTTLILNKLGSDKVSINPQLKKHRTIYFKKAKLF